MFYMSKCFIWSIIVQENSSNNPKKLKAQKKLYTYNMKNCTYCKKIIHVSENHWFRKLKEKDKEKR